MILMIPYRHYCWVGGLTNILLVKHYRTHSKAKSSSILPVLDLRGIAQVFLARNILHQNHSTRVLHLSDQEVPSSISNGGAVCFLLLHLSLLG